MSQIHLEQETVSDRTHRCTHHPTILRSILPEIKPHLEATHYHLRVSGEGRTVKQEGLTPVQSSGHTEEVEETMRITEMPAIA